MFDEAATRVKVDYDSDPYFDDPFDLVPEELQPGDQEAEARLGRVRARKGVEAIEELAALVELDRRHIWRKHGCRDMESYISGEMGYSHYKSKRFIEAAYAIRKLPYIQEALATGMLGIDKVVELTRFATPEDEVTLIRWARRVSVGTIKCRADRECARGLEEAAQADLARKLSFTKSEDLSMGSIHIDLPAAELEVAIKAIDRVATMVPTDPTEDDLLNFEDDAPLAARRADAFLMLCHQFLSEDADSGLATVVVRAPIGALLGDGTNCELESGAIVHPETARRLACDGHFEVVATDDRDRCVGIGRRSRTVPRRLMRELRHRFRTCTFPGCELKRFLQAHHIEPWELGGTTDLENLILVCLHHHKHVHEHGWNVKLRDDLLVDWYWPDGSLYVPAPRSIEAITRLPDDLRLELPFAG